ncbi:MAG: Ig-like domain-containing protein [Prevotella sp.]|nr:Ig-like domain-containing protein [Prevotella sp.]
MGNPDGGWYDETPPYVVSSSPADKGTDVKSRKIKILFNEFIKVENPTEKVVVSPPQLEVPEIKATGKRIEIELNDTLIPNTTYTIDFSDAISDNNEGNPMGNFTYTFSTGDHIDTLQVAGYVLQAEDLEPVKGILVGLYDDLADSAFLTKPLLRVSRTDSRGRFVIKGVAEGTYRIVALQDMDGDYTYTQKSEMLAFSHDSIKPSWKLDQRQDTTWIDSLHIDKIKLVEYNHFLPDDIVLRAFTAQVQDRYLLKIDRSNADRMTLFFTYGHEQLPVIKGLNFNEQDAFIVEASEKRDTITYWLRDTALVNQDTLRMDITYLATDTLGQLQEVTDSAVEVLSRQPYAKRMKQIERETEEWQKKQDKRRKRGLPYDSIMPVKPLEMKFNFASSLDPDRNLNFMAPAPLAVIDTSKIHLYVEHDSLWYNARHLLENTGNRLYELRAEWRPENEYSLEIDSAAFIDIYGNASRQFKQGLKVKSNDEYSSLFVTVEGFAGQHIVLQLLNASDQPVKQVSTDNGEAEFFYVKPATYYLRMFVDRNGNDQWDTGDYHADQQAEEVFYFHEEIECLAKWDINRTWNPTGRPINAQKPSTIIKQKGEKQKTIKNRNADRAKSMGITYIPKQ